MASTGPEGSEALPLHLPRPHPQEPVYGQGRRGDPEQATGAFATRLDDIQGPLKLSPGVFLDGVQAAWLHPEKFT